MNAQPPYLILKHFSKSFIFSLTTMNDASQHKVNQGVTLHECNKLVTKILLHVDKESFHELKISGYTHSNWGDCICASKALTT